MEVEKAAVIAEGIPNARRTCAHKKSNKNLWQTVDFPIALKLLHELEQTAYPNINWLPWVGGEELGLQGSNDQSNVFKFLTRWENNRSTGCSQENFCRSPDKQTQRPLRFPMKGSKKNEHMELRQNSFRKATAKMHSPSIAHQFQSGSRPRKCRRDLPGVARYKESQNLHIFRRIASTFRWAV